MVGGRVRRTAAALVASLVAGVGLVAVAPPALATTDTAVSLPLTSFRAVAYDDAHGHVFLTGGGSNGIVVRDAEGGAVTTITNEPGAAQMALSDDGSTLYVALSSGDAISAIDTTTLTEVARYPTGANTCPQTLAFTQGKVWFGYGCSGATGELGVVDPAATPPVVTLDQAPGGTFYYAPFLAASKAKPGLLAAGDGSSSPGALYLGDVSSGAWRLIAACDGGDFLRDVAFSADGSRVLTAAPSEGAIVSFSSTDLSPATRYPATLAGPNTVTVAPGGLVASSDTGQEESALHTYLADGTLVRSYDMRVQPQSYVPADRGEALSADASHLYAVTTDSLGGTVVLHVLHDPGKAVPVLTLVKPSTSPAMSTRFTLTGSLTSNIPISAGQKLTVERSSVYGNGALAPVLTGQNGAFSVTDEVSRRGWYAYLVSWSGDTTHVGGSARVLVYVHGLATTLTITTSAGPYPYGSKPLVVAHLGTTKVRTMSLYATPYGGSRTLLKTGTVDSYGNLSIAYYLTRNTVFSAVFAGDDTYEPRTTSKLLATRARLYTAVGRSYGSSHGWHLVHASTDPLVGVLVAPGNAGRCVTFVLQRYSSGAWHTIGEASCVVLDADSVAVGLVNDKHPSGTLDRVLAIFDGSRLNVSTTAPWVYLKFTS